jgi:hypothetical protein
MDERVSRNSNVGRRLKVFGVLVVMAFAVTLAVIVGNRLSDEALAVLAGAVCGVGAAIPTSLLIVSVTQRRREEVHTQPPTQQGAYPPVVVVTAPGTQQRPDAWQALPPSLTAPMQRQFTVVGGTPVDAEVRTYERYS